MTKGFKTYFIGDEFSYLYLNCISRIEDDGSWRAVSGLQLDADVYETGNPEDIADHLARTIIERGIWKAS